MTDVKPTQPNIPLEPTSTPPKNWLGKELAVGALVILAVAGIIGAYWYQTKPTPTPTADPDASVPTQGSGQVGAGETSNWKVYTNTMYGFEFKYPGYLYTEEPGYQNVLFYARSTVLPLNLGGVIQEEQIEGRDFVTKGWDFRVINQNKNGITIDLKTSTNQYTSEKLSLSGATAYKIKFLDGLNWGPDILVEIPNVADRYIKLGLSARCDQNICDGVKPDEIFNQIFSTFKFIE
ncbi:MAG: hypothetical protein HYV13_00915 [Candidatus Doudnabacteria bacterium]|nr:hypothetical protein [Candidatus Doudnabacteria bacterium]